jgi:hypothetical protein
MGFPTVTYTFSNSTTADATQVNQNFTDLINGVSDGTKNISVSAGTFAGTVNCQGAVTLGASSGNLLTINGSLASTINIGTTNSYDIGSDTFGLRALYLGSGSSAHSTKLAGASVSSAYVFTLPNGGGTSRYRLQTDGSGTTSWDPVRRSSFDAENLSLSTSVATNAMTITLNTAAGTGSSSTDPIDVVFRNATAGTGTPVTRTSTGGAITLTIPASATLGHQSSADQYIYVAVIDNAGTMELAVIGSRYDIDECSLISTTSITSGSTDWNTWYSTTGRSNVAFRLIGRIKSNQSTAGTWTANALEIALGGRIFGSTTTSSKSDLSWTMENCGTTSNASVWYSRLADRMVVRGTITLGTLVASTAAIDLPSGYNIDTSKMTSATNVGLVGTYECTINGASFLYSGNLSGVIFYDGSTSSKLFFAIKAGSTTLQLDKSTATVAFQGSQPLIFEFTIPIAQWRSY